MLTFAGVPYPVKRHHRRQIIFSPVDLLRVVIAGLEIDKTGNLARVWFDRDENVGERIIFQKDRTKNDIFVNELRVGIGVRRGILVDLFFIWKRLNSVL